MVERVREVRRRVRRVEGGRKRKMWERRGEGRWGPVEGGGWVVGGGGGGGRGG